MPFKQKCWIAYLLFVLISAIHALTDNVLVGALLLFTATAVFSYVFKYKLFHPQYWMILLIVHGCLLAWSTFVGGVLFWNSFVEKNAQLSTSESIVMFTSTFVFVTLWKVPIYYILYKLSFNKIEFKHETLESFKTSI
jgi:hypothetical protein